MSERRQRQGHLLLGINVLVWGAVFAVTKGAFASFHPVLFAALRFTASGSLLLLVALWREKNLRIERGDVGKIAVMGLIGIGVYQVVWSTGLSLTSATNSALILATQPLLGALYLHLWNRGTLKRSEWVAMIVAFLGVALIVLKPGARFQLSARSLLGDLLTLISALCFTIGFTIPSAPLLKRYSALKLTGYSMLCGSVLLLAGAFVPAIRMDWAAVPAKAWVSLAYAATLGGMVGHVLWFEGIARIGVTRTLVYQFIIPAWAMVVNALLLGETIHIQQVGGGALIFWGVYRALRR